MYQFSTFVCMCVCVFVVNVACHFHYLNSSRKSAAFQHMNAIIEKKLKTAERYNFPLVFFSPLLIYSSVIRRATENGFCLNFDASYFFPRVKKCFFFLLCFPFNCVVYKYNNSNSLKSYSLLTIRTFCFPPLLPAVTFECVYV